MTRSMGMPVRTKLVRWYALAILLAIALPPYLVQATPTVLKSKSKLGRVSGSGSAAACPLCPAIGAQTISESLTLMDVAVFAKLEERVDEDSAGVANARFRIVSVLYGDQFAPADGILELDYYGSSPLGTEFLLAAKDPSKLIWNDPIRMSEVGKAYVRDVSRLPQGIHDRLRFFWENLESRESVIAADAYDEFARAPYEDVCAIADTYQRTRLLDWIQDEEIPIARKRLYFMLLGICGERGDLPVLREVLKNATEAKGQGIDSMIACYLSLAGAAGMEWIEETYLKDADVGYSPTYGAIMALRFHGTDAETIPRARIVVAFRLLLDRPRMADLVIPDLARWEDWESAERLHELFLAEAEENRFIRVPIIIYMRHCPRQVAKEYLAEYERIDPESVERANLNFLFGG